MLHDAYGQNHKHLKEYYQAVDQGIVPITKGFELTSDDIIRRDVIMQIMSNFRLDFAEIEDKYHIDFVSYFGTELTGLLPMQQDGLLEIKRGRLEVTPLGRLLVRNIAVAFDTHILKEGNRTLSKTI
ncbi:MAG: oxygen-independent coproporphyrinogen III oxidase, partial [Microcoleaceae cyanobacterium]